jgi:exopolyphosphatase/guanosine-5'-triphosphate,3'-diphosphate pyrophosphatase
VIDVGTNSVRLLVAEVAPPPGPSPDPYPGAVPSLPEFRARPLASVHGARHDQPRDDALRAPARRARAPAPPPLLPVLRCTVITRLGDGLQEGGVLRPDAITRTAAAVDDYVARAAASGAPRPVIVGTYALRAARNPEAFLAHLRYPARVITETEEARLGFRGALAGLGIRAARARLLVVDIGGGSVELTWGTPRAVQGDRSLPLGCVVLTQRFLTGDPPSRAEAAVLCAHVAQLLDPVLEPLRRGPLRLIGVGGTITTLAALAQRLAPYDPKRVHNYRLSAVQIRAVTANLLSTPLDARRRLPGLQPERADVIVAGALVLQHLLDRVGCRAITVSEADLLWALALGL